MAGPLYGSCVRAIKWATLRIHDRGIIAYVTNGGFLSANSADGLRKTLAEEFTSIDVFNLRGNGRLGGEERRRDGRPPFEFGGWNSDSTEIMVTKGGAVATIAINIW